MPFPFFTGRSHRIDVKTREFYVVSGLDLWRVLIPELPFLPFYGAAVPPGPWPASEEALILVCVLLVSSVLVLQGSVMCCSERRPSILFLVSPLVIMKFPIKYFFFLILHTL